MHFLLFGAAACIEILGMLISVIGIGQLVGMNLIIILMALSFDVGRIVTVSALQRHWESFNFIMRTYGLIAIAITMSITSYGAAGYLTKAIQGGIKGAEQISTQVDYLKAEKAKLEERKKQIDDGIAKIPDTYTSRQRQNLMKNFASEQETVTTRIAELDKQIPELEAKRIETNSESSAIISLAKSFNVSVDTAIKWLVGMIIFVFEPFAIYLIMCGNHVMMKRQNKVKQYVETAPAVLPSEPSQEPTQPPIVAQEASDTPPDTTEAIEAPKEAEIELSLVPLDAPELTPTANGSTLKDVDDTGDYFINDIQVRSEIADRYRGINPIHV